jgi:PAS domain S-box-containing protein
MNKKQKILIVDDKTANLFTLAKTLQATDAEIVQTTTGNEALRISLNNEFALAIIDVQMPIMDGYELSELLRGEEKNRHLPIIFLTAVYSDERHIFRGYEAGAVDFIIKPYVPEILLNKVNIFLELDQQKRELIQHREHLEQLVEERSGELKKKNIKLQQEITEREKAEQEARQSEEKYRNLIMTMPDIVYTIDPDGLFTFVNDTVTELGYSPEELIGKHFSTIIYPDDVANVSRDHVLLRYKGKTTGDLGSPKLLDERRSGIRKTTHLEVRLIPKNEPNPQIGNLYIIGEIAASGRFSADIKSNEKIFLGSLGLIHNITERKLAEKEALAFQAKTQTLLEQANRSRRALLGTLEDQKRAEEQIKASLKEKEVMLQEIHHRVKNNLQIISGLLTLQADKAGEKSVAEIFQESQDRIRSIALIHEKLYQSQNLAEIDFSQYLRALIGNLFLSHGIVTGRITARYDMEPVFFTIEKAIPLGLIANELVTNALKHAFPGERNGEIHIQLHACKGTKFFAPTPGVPAYELVVADNGVGLPENFNLQDQKSLGMHLVGMLTKQLQAELAINRSDGTKFSILLKDEMDRVGG